MVNLNQNNISLRFLKESDALESVKWRNDPKIWELTVNKPNKIITKEDELVWINKVIKQDNSRRFAIIYQNLYVGNIQLTNIDFKNKESYYGIFIGETEFWGKGIASFATRLILYYAFEDLKLLKVKLRVRVNHLSAYKIYLKQGFTEVFRDDLLIHMQITKIKFNSFL